MLDENCGLHKPSIAIGLNDPHRILNNQKSPHLLGLNMQNSIAKLKMMKISYFEKNFRQSKLALPHKEDSDEAY